MSETTTNVNEPLRKKRKRTVIPPDQIDKLESLYLREQWPSRLRKEDLAQELGQTEHFVSVWFQNRRARQKKEELLSKQPPGSSGVQMRRILSAPQLTHGNNNEASVNDETKSAQESLNIQDQMDKTDHSIAAPSIKINKLCNVIKRTISIPSTYTLTKGLDVASSIKQVDFCKSEFGIKDQPKIMKILVKPKSSTADQKSSFVLAKQYIIPKEPSNLVSKSTATPSNLPQVIANHDKDQVVKTENDDECKTYSSSLFKTIINMICVAEGGIMDRHHQDYETAVNDSLYGIILNGNTRLVYSKDTGLELIPMMDKN